MQLVNTLSFLLCILLTKCHVDVSQYRPWELFGIQRKSQLLCSLSNSSEIDSQLVSTRKTTNVLSTETAKVGGDEKPKHIVETVKKEVPKPVDFDGWKRKKKKEIVPVATPAKPREKVARNSARNFASQECGATVIGSNPEAVNAKAVANDEDSDSYLRNPCEQVNKYVVIELCESIQITRIAIGNFELFASGPKKTTVQIAERYSPIVWIPLGSYDLNDTRKMQTFDVPDIDKYAKFVKIDFDEHHGSEYYCTVSVVRVMGTTLMDEYEVGSAESLAKKATQQKKPQGDVAPKKLKKSYVLCKWIIGFLLFWLFCALFCNLFKLE